MLKNNRPYTNEEGVKDTKLLTDLCPYEVNTAMSWIQENIVPADEVFCMSSYGLKHSLERMTGLYLTNNQFKDAMWLSGYKPEDVDELNWRYRVEFREIDCFSNPNIFCRWLGSFAFKQEDEVSNYASATLEDEDFPKVADYETILNYYDCTEADPETVELFKTLWHRFRKTGISIVPTEPSCMLHYRV